MHLTMRSLVTARFANFSIVRTNASSSSAASQGIRLTEAKGGSGDSKNPLCILLGWAWAPARQVDKFVELHTNAGRSTISFTMKAEYTITFDLDAQRSAARQVASVASGYGAESVVVHSFSFNGFCVYQQLASVLGEDRDGPRPRLAGAILDSGPGPWTVGQVFNFNGKNVEHATPNKISPLAGHFLLEQTVNGRSMLKAARSTLSLVPDWRRNNARHYHPDLTPGMYILKQRMGHPLLFLYSQADALMPAAFIKHVASEQRKANPGRAVKDWDFVKSPHVAHYKAFPQAYEEAVNTFVKDDVANFLRK